MRLRLFHPTANVCLSFLYLLHQQLLTADLNIRCGTGYSGSTQCDAGTVCVRLNDCKIPFDIASDANKLTDQLQGYSQCQPGQAPTQAPTSTVSTTVSTGPTTTTSTATAPATSIPAGALTRLTANFGTNPTNVAIYVYKPANVKNDPALLLALHGCGAPPR